MHPILQCEKSRSRAPVFCLRGSMSPWLVGEQNMGFLVSSHFSSHRPGDKCGQNLKEANRLRCHQERVLPLRFRLVMCEGRDVLGGR